MGKIGLRKGNALSSLLFKIFVKEIIGNVLHPERGVKLQDKRTIKVVAYVWNILIK